MIAKPTRVATAALSLLAALPAQFGNDRPGRDRELPKLEHFYFETWEFPSEHAAGGFASYSIYVPKAHDLAANAKRRFAWILWLPGFGGPEDFQTRGGAATLDALRNNDELPDVALVVFRAPGRRSRSTYMNGEAIGDIEDLIVSDLVAAVEQRFRVGGTAATRAVMGCSAGGFGAMKIALRHPDVFGVVATHSAAILPADPSELAGVAENMVSRYLRGGLARELGDPKDPGRIDPDKWAEQMPIGLVARRTPAQLRGLQIYFDAGTDDHYGFFEPNQQLAATMKRHGHRFFFREVEEGGHAWSSDKMRDNLAHSLRFVGRALSGQDAVAAAEQKAKRDTGDADGDRGDGGR